MRLVNFQNVRTLRFVVYFLGPFSLATKCQKAMSFLSGSGPEWTYLLPRPTGTGDLWPSCRSPRLPRCCRLLPVASSPGVERQKTFFSLLFLWLFLEGLLLTAVWKTALPYLIGHGFIPVNCVHLGLLTAKSHCSNDGQHLNDWGGYFTCGTIRGCCQRQQLLRQAWHGRWSLVKVLQWACL